MRTNLLCPRYRDTPELSQIQPHLGGITGSLKRFRDKLELLLFDIIFPGDASWED